MYGSYGAGNRDWLLNDSMAIDVDVYKRQGYSRDYESPSHYTQITVDAEGRISSGGEGSRKEFYLI